MVKVARHFIGVEGGGCPDIGRRRREGLSVAEIERPDLYEERTLVYLPYIWYDSKSVRAFEKVAGDRI